MFEIAFGGWLFFTIAVLFILSQAVLLFNNRNGASVGVLAAYAAAMFFLVDEWPTFNYKWFSHRPRIFGEGLQ